MSNQLLRGTLKIQLPPQRVSKANAKTIRERYQGGVDVPRRVQYDCDVAIAIKRALHKGEVDDDNGKLLHKCDECGCGVYSNGSFWKPNLYSAPHFGKEVHTGLASLVCGFINVGTGERITVSWKGDDVPSTLMDEAAHRDNGENRSATTAMLQFEAAQVIPWKEGEHNHSRTAVRHDIGKNGSARRRYDRLSVIDAEERRRRVRKAS